MGSACDCGQQSWQWSGSSGTYSGAVSQRVFAGALNPSGQPNCGSSCGQCYELSTSGFNAYNDGVGAGSTLTLQIVDACFSNGDHWCGSTSADYTDTSGCGVHFDIQTGAPGSMGSAPVGADGKTWNGMLCFFLSFCFLVPELDWLTLRLRDRWWPNRLLQTNSLPPNSNIELSIRLSL